MSLSSLLLPAHRKGKGPEIDTELDALFKQSPAVPAPKRKAGRSPKLLVSDAQQHASEPSTPTKKRKLDVLEVETKKGKKKSKANAEKEEHLAKPEAATPTTKAKDKSRGGKAAEESKKETGVKNKSGRKDKRQGQDPEESGVDNEAEELGEEGDEDEGDNSDLEKAYYQQRRKKERKITPATEDLDSQMDSEADEDEKDNSKVEGMAQSSSDEGSEDTAQKDDDSESSDDEGDPSQLIHETLQGKTTPQRSSSKPKMRYTPPDETPEQRDERTIFVGNLSVEVIEKKSQLKQLHRHILTHLPGAKIESTRFRSIAFQNPTSKLPLDEDTSSSSKTTPKGTTPATSARQHDFERASAWRETHRARDGGEAAEQDYLKKDEKKYLTPAQKKKIAFIHHEFHESAATANAYIVFAHHPPSDEQHSSADAGVFMNPYEAAKKAVELFDGTIYQERMLRVDLALRGHKRTAKASVGDVTSGAGDPKLTVFVGNLDFASQEEALRVFFEGVVSTERGPPPETDERSDVTLVKHSGWVTKVRIVRDKDTQLGKGFAYVQFADKQCVDEILAMEEGILKFAKRKLRVQRCKTLPGVSTKDHKAPKLAQLKNTKAASQSKSSGPARGHQPSTSKSPIVVPKGNPELGARLAGLSKEERKKLKSSDPERLARRIAKKKARTALGNAGVDVEYGSGQEKKQRTRIRKHGEKEKGTGKPKTKSKTRMRSEKSLAKRNTKK